MLSKPQQDCIVSDFNALVDQKREDNSEVDENTIAQAYLLGVVSVLQQLHPGIDGGTSPMIPPIWVIRMRSGRPIFES